MAKDENKAFDQTEKDLKYLIEKANNENAALVKILKKLSGDSQENEVDAADKKEKTPKKTNNY
ncbi:MAG: hypothetical protein PHX54_09345 [Lentimicrobiaceae bacterium]|nr:hypothetical protein [Lentimicrobiaceae bacterium]